MGGGSDGDGGDVGVGGTGGSGMVMAQFYPVVRAGTR